MRLGKERCLVSDSSEQIADWRCVSDGLVASSSNTLDVVSDTAGWGSGAVEDMRVLVLEDSGEANALDDGAGANAGSLALKMLADSTGAALPLLISSDGSSAAA
jgi:hypothetical protein